MSNKDLLVSVYTGHMTPAQAKAAWIAPHLDTVWSIACLTSSSSVTSHFSVIIRSLLLNCVCLIESSWSSLRSPRATLQPWEWNSRAVARPRPDAAPVMNITVS